MDGQYIKDVIGTRFEPATKQIGPVRTNPLMMPIVGTRGAWTSESFHASLTTIGAAAAANAYVTLNKAKPETVVVLPRSGAGYSYYITGLSFGIYIYATTDERGVLEIASTDLASAQVVLWKGVFNVDGDMPPHVFPEAIPVGDNLSIARKVIVVTAAQEMQLVIHVHGYRMAIIATTAPA